ncbi:hypothetical protein PCE1_004350 [Barthelona sp. PCE]
MKKRATSASRKRGRNLRFGEKFEDVVKERRNSDERLDYIHDVIDERQKYIDQMLLLSKRSKHELDAKINAEFGALSQHDVKKMNLPMKNVSIMGMIDDVDDHHVELQSSSEFHRSCSINAPVQQGVDESQEFTPLKNSLTLKKMDVPKKKPDSPYDSHKVEVFVYREPESTSTGEMQSAISPRSIRLIKPPWINRKISPDPTFTTSEHSAFEEAINQ